MVQYQGGGSHHLRAAITNPRVYDFILVYKYINEIMETKG